MIRASDIAYLIALVEKAPSHYPRRAELIEELQNVYRATQGRRYGTDVTRFPVVPSFGGILDVQAD